MLTPDQTNELGDLVEHLFDRVSYMRTRVEKVQGALEALEYWWVTNADPETIHGRPIPSASASEDGVDA